MVNLFKKFTILILIFSLTTVLAFASPSVTNPGFPNQYFGTVTVNDQAAPDNLFVEARIGNGVFTTLTNNGQYGYDPIFYVEDPNHNRDSLPVNFYVGTSSTNMVQAQSSTFQNGQVTRLDLEVTGLTLPNTGGGNTGGGGTPSTGGGTTGGGGGTFVATTTQETEETDESEEAQETDVQTTSSQELSTENEVCESNWVCSEWTECINFQQKRVCVDSNNCNLDDQPILTRECDLTDEELGLTPEAPATGFIIGNTGTLIGSILGFLLIGGLIYFFAIRKKPEE